MCVAGSLSSVGFVTGGFVVRASSFSSARFATAASRTTASSFGATLGETFFASSARAVESRARRSFYFRAFPEFRVVPLERPRTRERPSREPPLRPFARTRGAPFWRFRGLASRARGRAPSATLLENHPARPPPRRLRRRRRFAGCSPSPCGRRGTSRGCASRCPRRSSPRRLSSPSLLIPCHRIHRSIHPTTRKKKKTKKKPRVPSETGSRSSFGACSSYHPSRACASCFSGRPCASCPCASWASSPGRRASSDSWRSSPSRATPPRPRGATRADAPGTPGSAPRYCSAPSQAAGGSPPCRAARARPH